MSSGDDIEAGRITTAESTTDLVGAVPSEGDVDFNGNVILRVGPQRGDLTPNHTLDGIHGLATNSGRIPPSAGGTGVVGFGGPHQGTGVLGLGGASGGGSGSLGSGGMGVHGIGGDGRFVTPSGPINPGTGVLGVGGKPDLLSAQPAPMPGGVGVMGIAEGPADGVVGFSDANVKSGVFGFNSKTEGDAFGVFGRCDSPTGVGVGGGSRQGDGVRGISEGSGRGVYGESVNGVGVVGLNRTKVGLAGFFQGRLTVVGDFTVFAGAKSAAVPHPDGSHRLLYSIESPESWFEDFGEAKLINGEAKVQLDPEFASVVKTDTYHVFLTPYGDSNGLYVSRRSESDFDVREQGGGKSNISFSYRIAAKRRDINGKRLAKTKLPERALSEAKPSAPPSELPYPPKR